MDEAARYFESARALDPSFGAALQRAQSAASTTAKLESAIRSSGEGITAIAPTVTTLSNVVGDVNPTTTNTIATTTTTTVPPPRNPSSDKTGTDQPAPRTGQVTIVIKKP